MKTMRFARERGANLVEAAIIIPLLLIPLLGVFDLGRAYFAYLAVIDAAREGARYGASHVSDPNRNANICARVLAEASGQPLPVTLSCASNVTIATTGAQGTPVYVTVRADVPMLLGAIVGRTNLPISYRSAFRIRCAVGAGC